MRTVTLLAGVAIALTLPATGAFATPGGADPAAGSPARANETIRNQNSGKCLEIQNSGTGNGNAAQQWDCVGQPGAYWYPVGVGNGLVEYHNANSGKCLEVQNSSTADGARVQQWDCVGIATQRWRSVWDAGVGAWRQVNAHSGKCLEVQNSSTANGARVQQWTCVDRVRTQAWYGRW